MNPIQVAPEERMNWNAMCHLLEGARATFLTNWQNQSLARKPQHMRWNLRTALATIQDLQAQIVPLKPETNELEERTLSRQSVFGSSCSHSQSTVPFAGMRGLAVSPRPPRASG